MALSPFPTINTQSETNAWLDSRVSIRLILIRSLPISRWSYWIRYSFRKEYWEGMDSKNNSLIHSTNRDWVSLTGIVAALSIRDKEGFQQFLRLEIKTKMKSNIIEGFFCHIKTMKLFQNWNHFQTVVSFPKEASRSCPCIRMSIKCYAGNIGDCELIQEAKEMKLGMWLVLQS